MGHVTRHEVGELIKRFEDRVMPKSMSLGMPGLLYQGINAVKFELSKTTGAPELQLRNYARVLKHYIEAPVDPKNIYYANTAIHLLGENKMDATAAIKKARKTYEAMMDPKRIQKDAKKAMQRIQAEEQRQAEQLATQQRGVAAEQSAQQSAG